MANTSTAVCKNGHPIFASSAYIGSDAFFTVFDFTNERTSCLILHIFHQITTFFTYSTLVQSGTGFAACDITRELTSFSIIFPSSTIDGDVPDRRGAPHVCRPSSRTFTRRNYSMSSSQHRRVSLFSCIIICASCLSSVRLSWRWAVASSRLLVVKMRRIVIRTNPTAVLNYTRDTWSVTVHYSSHNQRRAWHSNN